MAIPFATATSADLPSFRPRFVSECGCDSTDENSRRKICSTQMPHLPCTDVLSMVRSFFKYDNHIFWSFITVNGVKADLTSIFLDNATPIKSNSNFI